MSYTQTDALQGQLSLEEARKHFLTLDQKEMITRLSLRSDGQRIFVPFFSQTYVLQRSTGLLFYKDRSATSDESLLIYTYLTKASASPAPTGKWVPISKLAPSVSLSPLAQKLSVFDGKISLLKEACLNLGGVPSSSGEVSSILPVFPGLSLLLEYWQAEEDFDANIQFLWDETAPEHLPLEDLLSIQDYLVDRLIKEAEL